MVGQGPFSNKHLDAITQIDGVEVATISGGSPDTTEAVANKHGIPHWTTHLAEALGQPDVEAAILTSPTQIHDGNQNQIDVSKVAVSMNGIELQDREFVAAIREGREPNASVADVLPCYEVLRDLDERLSA